MTALTFDGKELIKLVEDATASWPKGARELYGDKTGPGFWLVGDHGVYLMHNGPVAEGGKPLVVYARECNPETCEFDDWWEAKRASFGGDDGVEFLEPAAILDRLGHDVRIRLTSKTVEIVTGKPVSSTPVPQRKARK